MKHKSKSILNTLSPVIYLVIWLVFIYTALHIDLVQTIDSNLFLLLSFLVLFFGLITKSSSWAIGNQLFNISGDSKRHVEYSWHENWPNSDQQRTGYTIKIDHDNPETIKTIMSQHKQILQEDK